MQVIAMIDNCNIRLESAISTKNCGQSLASSFYTKGTTILLTGELGAGKTTFLQGFAKGLGIDQDICSPTYALEQRYKTNQWDELLHIDLYRLSNSGAQELIEGSDVHDGIRCIEWAERLETLPEPPTISIHISEISPTEREVNITFNDILLPTEDQIRNWQDEFRLPENVIAHCNKVGEVAEKMAIEFLKQGKVARPAALMRAGQLHDLFRFLDFHPGSSHLNIDITDEQQAHWGTMRSKYNEESHEPACAEFLRKNGFSAIATMIETHGMKGDPPLTIEQKLLFYADKRVILDRVASLRERFDDFAIRYNKGKESAQSIKWLEQCEQIEKELFPDGPPF